MWLIILRHRDLSHCHDHIALLNIFIKPTSFTDNCKFRKVSYIVYYNIDNVIWLLSSTLCQRVDLISQIDSLRSSKRDNVIVIINFEISWIELLRSAIHMMIHMKSLKKLYFLWICFKKFLEKRKIWINIYLKIRRINISNPKSKQKSHLSHCNL